MSEVLCNVLNSNKDDGLYLGMPVTVALTGSHTKSAYQTKIVWISQDRKTIHLLGQTSLGSGTFTTNRAYRWNVSVTIGTNTYTINDCMTPTSAQIYTYCSGYYTGFAYWLNDYSGSTGWLVHVDGSANGAGVSTSFGAVPYIVVNL